MGNVLKRNVVLVVAVLLAGWLLRSIDSLSGLHLGKWTLGQLIWWGSFSFAGVVAAASVGIVGDSVKRPVLQSVYASRLAGAALLGAALWLLAHGAKPVLVPAWQPTVQKAVALAAVGIVAYAVWLLYGGFDDLSAALHRFRPVPAPAAPLGSPTSGAVPRTPETPRQAGSVFCGACGTLVPPTDRFCGGCGAPVASRA